MTKTKTTGISAIIGNGTKLYLQNFFPLTAPVVAPVLGMFLGLALMVLPIYLLPKFYPMWTEFLPVLKEFFASLIVIILALLPGLIVFKIAFWNYMLKMVSLNNIVGDILKKKVVKPHQHYTQIIALRTKDYLLMLAIWCSIILMGLALPVIVFLLDIEPLFVPYLLIGFEFLAIFLLTILSIYLSLSFQVFAFETSFGPMQVLEESFRLVLNNFWRLVTIMVILWLLTSIIIPQSFVFLSDILMLKSTMSIPFKIFLENVFSGYNYLYDYLQTLPVFTYESQDKFILEMAKLMTIGMISTIISLLMMPLGSCYYTLFYFDAKKRNAPKIEEIKEEQSSKKNKKSAKK